MDDDADMSSNQQSGSTSPMGSTTWATAVDESVPGMSPPAFTALQEPWPPTRSGTPSDDDRPGFSPIREDQENNDESDTDTATPPLPKEREHKDEDMEREQQVEDKEPIDKESADENKDKEEPNTAASVPLPTNPPNTAASPGLDTPPLPPPIPPNSAASPPASPPHPPVVPPNTASSPMPPPNPPNTAVNAADEPPLTAIPLDPSARFRGLDTGSPMPSPVRRTFGINPFLKRSLGGMLRDTPRTRSARSSADLSHPVSVAASPVTNPLPIPDDESKDEPAKADETSGEGEAVPSGEADKNDSAAATTEQAPVPAAESTEVEMTPSVDVEVTLSEEPAAPKSAGLLTAEGPDMAAKTDTDPSSPLLAEPTTRSRRPTGVFSNAAFLRQVQGYIRPEASAFKPEPSPLATEFSKRDREDDDAEDEEAKADKNDEEDKAETKGEETSSAPEPAPASPHAPSPAASPVVATTSTEDKTETAEPVASVASPPADSVADPVERPRSPPKDPTATKRLKPTAAPFIPKPTAPVFVPRFGAVPSPPTRQPGIMQPVPRAFTAPIMDHVAQMPIAFGAPVTFAPVAFTPRSTNMQPRSLSATLTKSPSGLRPNALPFVPGVGPSFGATEPETPSSGDSSNSLGLFTFTAKLRPTASEFKPISEIKPEYKEHKEFKPNPRTGPNGTPYRPPPLDLSRSEPASRAFELLGNTPFEIGQDEQPGTAASDVVPRRHSFKESMDHTRKQAFHDSDSVDLGRRHSFKESADLQPWRTEASPRSDRARSEHSISEVSLGH